MESQSPFLPLRTKEGAYSQTEQILHEGCWAGSPGHAQGSAKTLAKLVVFMLVVQVVLWYWDPSKANAKWDSLVKVTLEEMTCLEIIISQHHWYTSIKTCYEPFRVSYVRCLRPAVLFGGPWSWRKCQPTVEGKEGPGSECRSLQHQRVCFFPQSIKK